MLGPSGAGKSTSIVILNEQPLSTYHKNLKPVLVNKGHKSLTHKQMIENKITEVYIGNQHVAATIFPAYLPLKGTDFYFYDLPGFGDNKGVTQNLVNAYYINRIFDLHKEVSLFVALRYNDLA